MSRSKLQNELAERAAKEEKILSMIRDRTAEIQKDNQEKVVSLDEIVREVLLIGDDAKIVPLRNMSTFNRSFKTQDVGKITAAVAHHLFGKFRVPTHLTNAWNHLIPEKKQATTQYPTWRERQRIANARGGNAQIPHAEIKQICIWYVVAASGGSLWKEQTRSRKSAKGDVIPQFTRQENHDFLTCRIKDCTFREAVIYAIAMGHTNDLGIINRICKTNLVEMCPRGQQPIEYYTRPLIRQTIQMFCENKATVQELNDILDYINHMSAQQAFNLKGRTFAWLKKAMNDWHWEMARVRKMGNADWTAYKVPVDDEEFTIPQTPGVGWKISQITTSKALAAEGTAQRHCVYSYQSRCIDGSCAIWSLKRTNNQSKEFERALTIEMNAITSTLVQIRGIANRAPRQDEMAAVKYWANKNGIPIARFA